MLSTFSYLHLTSFIFVSLTGATSIKFDLDNNDGLAYLAHSPTYASVTTPSSETLVKCRAYLCLAASRGKSGVQTPSTVCDPSDQDCLRKCNESLFDCCRSFFKADELDKISATCLHVSTQGPGVIDGGLPTTTLPSPSSASSDVQWWWFIVPLITMTTIFVAMAACWCLRLHKAEWGAQVSSTTDLDESNHPHDRSPTTSSTSSPISVVIMEPPPYDSLPKDPPPYDEIYNYNDYEAPPPSRQSSRRQRGNRTHGRSSVNNRHHHHHQQQPVTMTTEPPYTDVIC